MVLPVAFVHHSGIEDFEARFAARFLFGDGSLSKASEEPSTEVIELFPSEAFPSMNSSSDTLIGASKSESCFLTTVGAFVILCGR